jgi:hypothetical protein
MVTAVSHSDRASRHRSRADAMVMEFNFVILGVEDGDFVVLICGSKA